MLKRNWLYGFAAALALMAIVGSAVFFHLRQPNQPDQTAATYYDYASQKADDWLVATQEHGQAETACSQGEKTPNCSEQYSTSLDLMAQWAAANAARRLVWLTEIQTAIAVAGLLGVSITIAVTIATFLTTNRTARAQLRAYVMVKGTDFKIVSGTVPKIKVTLENFGETPAHDVNVWGVGGFQNYPVVGPLPASTNKPSTAHPLAPGAALIIPIKFEREMSDATMAALQKGTHAIFVVGCVMYKDAFGKQQRSDFCLFYGGPMGIGEGFAPYTEGNSAT